MQSDEFRKCEAAVCKEILELQKIINSHKDRIQAIFELREVLKKEREKLYKDICFGENSVKKLLSSV